MLGKKIKKMFLPKVNVKSSSFKHHNFMKSYDLNLEDSALYAQNVIAYRCIQVISRGVGSIPWVLYNKEVELEEHPLLTLLKFPNIKQANASFREELISNLLIHGNAYILKLYNDQGFLEELNLLHPQHTKVVKGESFIPKAYEYKANGKAYNFPIDPQNGSCDVLHIKFFNPHDHWYGLSPLKASESAIEQHEAVCEHNLSILKNGGRPTGAFIIKPDQYGSQLTDEQRARLTQDIKNFYEGPRNAGKVLFLEGDFDWKEMGSSLKDLDFLNGKNLSAREIAQAFGVPPMLVGVPGDATFSNYREARYHLWEDTILPLMDIVVSEFNRWIARDFEKGIRISYDADAIPALALRREASWEKIAHVDFLTTDEKRQAVGYGKLSNEQKLG